MEFERKMGHISRRGMGANSINAFTLWGEFDKFIYPPASEASREVANLT